MNAQKGLAPLAAWANPGVFRLAQYFEQMEIQRLCESQNQRLNGHDNQRLFRYRMAKFLNGSGVQSALTDIITNAERKLLIISPYLNIPVQTKNYLKSIDKKGVPIIIILRTNEKITKEDTIFFESLKNLTLGQCENLHSKCYINDKEGLITSMNLYEHSVTHNWEMGIRFSLEQDSEIYNEVIRELERLQSQTKPVTIQPIPAEVKNSAHTESPKKSNPKLAHKPTEAPKKGTVDKILDVLSGYQGYCIRCGKELKTYDMEKPYCDKCHASWARYNNPKYKEKFCHACGGNDKQHPTSFEKPVCKPCYTKLYPK